MHTLAILGSFQMPELIIVLVVVLIIFGPKALPKLARSLGSSIREFKNATSKMTEEIMTDEDEEPESRPRQEVEGQAARSSSSSSTDQESEKVSSSS